MTKIKYQKGFKFMSVNEDYEVLDYISNVNMYLIKDITNNRDNILMSESDIDNHVKQQEDFKQRRQELNKFRQQQEQAKHQEQLKQQQKQEKYNNTYGYTNNLKPYQKGKILKTLNKKLNYSDYGILKRKDFILTALKEGFKPTIKDKVLISTRKTKELERQENYKYNVPVMDKNNKFYEITKIEYNYAMYLLENRSDLTV